MTEVDSTIATPSEAVPDELDAGTRRRVLELIASEGPASAADLARELDLTPAAIRRHLAMLEGSGQIGVHASLSGTGPARRGRPAKRYVVTGRGQDAMSQRYSELASQALRYVAELGGEDAVRAFAERRFREFEARYTDVVAAAGTDVESRARVLADGLAEDGFAASARPLPTSGAIQLCQGHCPVQQVATEFPELCEAEAQAFSRMLGVHVQRLATLAGGGHVCTTNVPTTVRISGPPHAAAPSPSSLTEG